MPIHSMTGWLVAGLVGLGVAPTGEATAPPEKKDDPSANALLTREAISADERPLRSDATLDDLIRFAVAHNPLLSSAEAEHRAAGETIVVASALPDPRVAFNIAVEPIETRVGPQHGQILVSQTLPGPGKRAARADVARADADAAWRRYERQYQKLVYTDRAWLAVERSSRSRLAPGYGQAASKREGGVPHGH